MKIEDRYLRLSARVGATPTELIAEAKDVTAEVERAFALRDRLMAAVGEHDQSVRDDEQEARAV